MISVTGYSVYLILKRCVLTFNYQLPQNRVSSFLTRVKELLFLGKLDENEGQMNI